MRRIGVFTATRAEYGLLAPVLEALDASKTLEPCLIVSGAHLSERHGLTVREIEADGRAIAAHARLPLAGDDGVSVAQDMAAATAGVAKAAVELKLDALMLLGDRTETLGAAIAAVPLALPILHLEGGHRTAGAVDDAIRHAITKLAALHFTAHPDYARRLRQMGEADERIFVVGSTATDRLARLPALSLDALNGQLGSSLRPGFLLATLHPETLSALTPADQAARFLQALEGVDADVLFTLPNADAGGQAITAAIQAFVASHSKRTLVVPSLGADRYLQAARLAGAVIGNSSSGVIEAPMVRTPSVDIGERQAGRLKTPGVIHAAFHSAAIREAIQRALDPALRRSLADSPPPFGDGRAAERIVEVLERFDLTGLARKPFVDR